MEVSTRRKGNRNGKAGLVPQNGMLTGKKEKEKANHTLFMYSVTGFSAMNA
jgi:hypothetical protein